METTMTTAELLSALNLEDKENDAVQQPYQSEMTAMQAVKAAAEQARQVPAYIQQLETAMPHILELCQFISDNRDVYDVPSDVGKPWGEVMGWILSKVVMILNGNNDKARRTVYLETIKYKFKDGITQSQAVKEIDWCFEQGFFIPSPAGEVVAGKRRFEIPKKFGLTDEEKLKVASRVQKAFVPKAVAAPKKPAPPAKPKSASTDKITAGQAWRGKLGKFELHIPPNGTRKAGTLQMELQDGQILFVSEASNGLADLENLSIQLSALKDKSGKPDPVSLKVVPPDHLFGDALEKWQMKAERLGAILVYGFQAAIEGQHNIDPKEFLTTNVVGDSELTFVGPFDWRPNDPEDEGVFPDLTLRFHRRDDGQIALVEIVSEEAQDFPLLEEVIGKYCEPGQAFTKMYPAFLKAFLRAVYRQVVQGRYDD
jgi:hypothetical protein